MGKQPTTTLESTREFANWLKDNKKEICEGSTLKPSTTNALTCLKICWEQNKKR